MSLVARFQALFNVPSLQAGDLVRLRFGPDVSCLTFDGRHYYCNHDYLSVVSSADS